MRYIIEFTLRDKTKMTCITNGIDRNRAIDYCVNASNRLFNPLDVNLRKYRLDKKMPNSIDSWKDKDNANMTRYGGKYYTVLLVSGNQTMTNNIEAGGIKSAYNQLIQCFGHNVPLTFIYDMGQVPQRKSSRGKATEILRSEKETDNLLNNVIHKIKDIPGIGQYAADIPILCDMIRDYVRQKYKKVPVGTIVGCTAALIYISHPVGFLPDFLSGIGQLDDGELIKYVLKLAHNDIQEYAEWRKQQQQQTRSKATA